MYTTLLFDIDDTLLDFKIAKRVAISKTLENIGITTDLSVTLEVKSVTELLKIL